MTAEQITWEHVPGSGTWEGEANRYTAIVQYCEEIDTYEWLAYDKGVVFAAGMNRYASDAMERTAREIGRHMFERANHYGY